MKSTVIYRYLAPFFIFFYLSVLFVQLVVIKSTSEIFPFFSWSLFSQVPKENSLYYFIEVNYVDGKQTEAIIIAPHNHARGSNVNKAIRKALSFCSEESLQCSPNSSVIITPYINEILQYKELEVSLVKCKINLKRARQNIINSEKFLPIYKGREDCDETIVFDNLVIKRGDNNGIS
jgi:hypothetical protein